MADLKGTIALVTGASQGVGRGVALGLAEAGATVYLTGRRAGTLQATAAAVNELGGQAIPVVLDHGDDQQVVGLLKRIEAEAGRLDLLVNNAFQIPDPQAWEGGFWEHPLSTWDDQCGVGLRGYYVAAALSARLMVAQRRGLIVNISSAAGTDYRFNTAYGVGKAGVDRMAVDMARELRTHTVAALSLVPDESTLQTPQFVGRCVAALAMDPDVMEKTGGRFSVAELAREYRFSELADS